MKNSIGLENEQLITKDNVQQLGEILAVSAVKKTVNFKPIYARLYRELVHNVFDPLQDNERFGEGYELVQETCCFLCNFIGKRLGDTYKTDKHGNGNIRKFSRLFESENKGYGNQKYEKRNEIK